jgi:hypothetical protein
VRGPQRRFRRAWSARFSRGGDGERAPQQRNARAAHGLHDGWWTAEPLVVLLGEVERRRQELLLALEATPDETRELGRLAGVLQRAAYAYADAVIDASHGTTQRKPIDGPSRVRRASRRGVAVPPGGRARILHVLSVRPEPAQRHAWRGRELCSKAGGPAPALPKSCGRVRPASQHARCSLPLAPHGAMPRLQPPPATRAGAPPLRPHSRGTHTDGAAWRDAGGTRRVGAGGRVWQVFREPHL